MLLTVAILAVVSLLLVHLVLACLAAARDGDEAHEELNERIRQLHRVASVRRTGAAGVQQVYRRAQPFRRILEDVPGVGGQPPGR
jgi:hypothetical protein